MRKIKITALLLAVLMVVTAFAGCASKSTVSNLDNKVNDLDAEIKNQASLLQEIKDALTNQGSSSELDDIKSDVEENKQNVSDILEAIKGLEDKLAGATGESEDVKAAISKAGAKIEALQGEYAENKSNYTAEDYAAILAIFGDAQASISTCLTVEAVDAALEAMAKALAEHKSYPELLYSYVVALTGNITDDSAELVEEAVEALADAREFYKNDEDKLTYEYEKDKTIKLGEEIEKLQNLQTGTGAGTLSDVKARAKALVKDIDAIDADDTFAEVTEIVKTYKLWAKDAAKLSEKNVALVTNYDELVAAQNSALNAETAKLMFGAETITSVLVVDAEVGIFGDYVALGKDAVVFTYTNKDGDKDLTSKIYAAIDAKVAAWADEYDLTDDAVEYIIDDAHGTNFYAKYNSDKALVKAFEAEYKNFEKIASAIKALNSKKLSSDALSVVNAYIKNAEDINAWANALVVAYEAELKADADKDDNRNVNTKNKYVAALNENFQAMIIEAKLGVYDKDAKTYDNEYEFEILAKVDVASGVTSAYYHNLYDFKDTNLATFLSTEFATIKGEADAINAKIAAIRAAQVNSIATLAVGIEGYVKESVKNGVKVLEAIDADEFQIVGKVDTIAEFVKKYEKYGLAGMIDKAAYDAKLAAVEANIKAANAALAAVNDKYVDLLGDEKVVVVNMGNYASILNLHTALQAWVVAGNTNMEVATLTNTTAAGVKEYTLVSIRDLYDFMVDDVAKVLDPYDGMIVKLKDAANYLKNEADLVVNAYSMMDRVSEFGGSFGFVDMGGQLGTIVAAIKGNHSNLKQNGVVSVTVGDPMTIDTATYKKGDRLWTVEFVTFESGDGRTLDSNLSTKKFTVYDSSNNVNQIPAAVQAEIAARVWLRPDNADSLSSLDVTTYNLIQKQVFEEIPGIIKGQGSSLISLQTYFGANNGKMIANYQLPALAMALEAKFVIDNGGAYKPIETAKAKFDPTNGGYGFDWVKAMSYGAIAAARGILLDAGDTTIRSAFSNVNTLDALMTAVKQINDTVLVKQGVVLPTIAFGGADHTWLSVQFDINQAADVCWFNPNRVTWAELGIDITDRKVASLVIYDAAFDEDAVKNPAANDGVSEIVAAGVAVGVDALNAALQAKYAELGVERPAVTDVSDTQTVMWMVFDEEIAPGTAFVWEIFDAEGTSVFFDDEGFADNTNPKINAYIDVARITDYSAGSDYTVKVTVGGYESTMTIQ